MVDGLAIRTSNSCRGVILMSDNSQMWIKLLMDRLVVQRAGDGNVTSVDTKQRKDRLWQAMNALWSITLSLISCFMGSLCTVSLDLWKCASS